MDEEHEEQNQIKRSIVITFLNTQYTRWPEGIVSKYSQLAVGIPWEKSKLEQVLDYHHRLQSKKKSMYQFVCTFVVL